MVRVLEVEDGKLGKGRVLVRSLASVMALPQVIRFEFLAGDGAALLRPPRCLASRPIRKAPLQVLWVLLPLIHEPIPMVRTLVPLGQLVVVVPEELGGVECEPHPLCPHATFGARDAVVRGARPDIASNIDAETRLTADV